MLHPFVEFLRHSVVRHGYWAVGAALLVENVGVPVPGETILLLASFLAYSEHELQLPWIIVVATLVTTMGGCLGFALGCYGGRPLLARYQSLFRIQDTTLGRAEKLFAQYGATTVFLARFVFGIRIIAGPLAGVLHMPWRKFLLFNFFGAAAWVTVVSSAGFLFGRHWHELERALMRFNLVAALLLILVLFFLWWNQRRERNGASGK
jgi:membrane protein DedA with SNARE-associated domain